MAVYRQVHLGDDLPQIEKKIVIEVYGEEKQMLQFKAAPNKKYQ